MAVYALEARMFASLPFATYISNDTLEAGVERRAYHGDRPWLILPWLLLVPDGTAVLRRDHEFMVDWRPSTLCFS